MHIILLHALIVIPFLIHVVKTGQSMTWIYVLLMAPFIGSLVYFIAIIIPSFRSTRSGYKLERKIRLHLSPGAELKAAIYDYELTATHVNTVRLADAYAGTENYVEALPLYKSSLTGIHRYDPDVMLKFAIATFNTGDAVGCRGILDELRKQNPDFNSANGHLYYAKSLARCGEVEAAKSEFEALVGYYAGFEARVSYAEALVGFDEPEKAKEILDRLFVEAKRVKPHVRELNSESLKRARGLAKSL